LAIQDLQVLQVGQGQRVPLDRQAVTDNCRGHLDFEVLQVSLDLWEQQV